MKLTLHEESAVKLKSLVEELTKPKNMMNSSSANIEKIKKISIRLTKVPKKCLAGPGKL